MPVRLIAIDVDGTLLDGRGRLPEANRQAIQESLAQGLHVALATGRSYPFARSVISQLPSPLLLILSNGAVARIGDGTVHRRRLLPRGVARHVLDFTEAYRDTAALIFDRDGRGQIVSESMDWSDTNRSGYLEKNRRFIARHARLEGALTEDPIQIMFNGGVERMRALVSELSNSHAPDGIHVAVTEYENRDFALVDVLTAGCSKASTLKEWAADLGVAPEEIMAVGDNLNDEEMLEMAGLPVVMGNAVGRLRERDWRITGTNDEAGLADAIRNFALGQHR